MEITGLITVVMLSAVVMFGPQFSGISCGIASLKLVLVVTDDCNEASLMRGDYSKSAICHIWEQFNATCIRKAHTPRPCPRSEKADPQFTSESDFLIFLF